MAKDKNHKNSMRSCLVGHIESFHDTQAKMAAKKAARKAYPSTKGVGDGKGKGTPAAAQQRYDQNRADSVRVPCLCHRVDCTFTLTGNQATKAVNWRSHLLSSRGCADAVRQGYASGTTNEFDKAHKHLVEVWTETTFSGKKWLDKKASLAWREAGRPTDQEFSVAPGAFR